MIDLVKIREHIDYCKTVHASDSRPYALASEVESLLSEVERLNRELAVKDEHRDEVRKALGLRDTVGTITGARLVIESRDNAKRERNELLAKCEDATRAVERITNERDALREHSNNIHSALNLADGSDAVLCAKLVSA